MTIEQKKWIQQASSWMANVVRIYKISETTAFMLFSKIKPYGDKP